MTVKEIYKQLVPMGVRNFVAGHPRLLPLRNRLLVREGQRLADAARAVRKPDGKIRVTFIVQRPALWPNQKSVYEDMLADPAFAVSVIAIPKIPPAARVPDLAEYGRLMAFLAEKNIAFFKGYDESALSWINPLKFGLPDIVFLPQPYVHTQSFLYNASYLKQYCKLAIYNYGTTVDDLQLYQHYLPTYSDCHYIFMESQEIKGMFGRFAPALADQLIVTGHPKLDVYREPMPTDTRWWKVPAAKKRLIWAPHFTVTDDRTPHTFSTFFDYYEFFLEFTRNHPEVEVVLRPHPELFEHMVATGLRTRKEAEAYRNRFNALPNGQVNEGGDIFAMFRQSDALILDCISFLAEYLPTGRPICFLDSLRRQRLNPIGERLLHAYYTAWTPEEVEEFIRTVVMDGDDYRRGEREQVAREHLYLPPGGAGMEIKNRIKQEYICP